MYFEQISEKRENAAADAKHVTLIKAMEMKGTYSKA